MSLGSWLSARVLGVRQFPQCASVYLDESRMYLQNTGLNLRVTKICPEL